MSFRINPVTKKAEPYLPPHQKAYRFVLAYSFVIFMVGKLLKLSEFIMKSKYLKRYCSFVFSYYVF